MTQFNPYLKFQGNCRAAMEFYKSVFGGELYLSTYGESGQSKNEEEKNLIMHSTLKNDFLNIYATDGNEEHKVTFGDNISLSISGEDEETLTKYFNELSEGGKIDLPLEKQFWGDTFGMLTDKFGINWMINIEKKKE